MTGFCDIHSHFIYGVDDGAKTRETMEAMLDAAYADGITSLFATPHVIPGVQPFDMEAYARHFDEACAYCQERNYAMALYAGAEIMYTPVLKDYVVDHRLPTLAGSDHVLMEFTPDITLQEMESAFDLMGRYGYITVLAHMERYACLFHKRAAAKVKKRHDVRYQVNANTILKKQSLIRSWYIHHWFQESLVDFVASDAHNVNTRPYQMKRAYTELERKYGQTYAGQLVLLSDSAYQ